MPHRLIFNMTKPKKPPVRHHYVPAFLLRNFTSSDGVLWIYDAKNQKSWEGCPESAGFERHWHTISKKGGVSDSESIEKIVTDRYDSPGASAVKKLLNQEQLDPASIVSFFRFVASLMLRTPRSIREMNEIGSAVLDESVKRLAAHNDEFQARVAEGLKDAGANDETIASLLKDLSGGKIPLKIRHEITLLTNLMEVEPLAQALASLNWMFCVLPDSEDDFIIGDHPVLLEDVGPSEERGYLGVLNPNIELILPLGRRMAAVANRWCKPSYGVFQFGMSEVFNRRTLLWAERFVYAGQSSENLLNAAIRHYKRGPKVSVENGVSKGAAVIKFERKY